MKNDSYWLRIHEAMRLCLSVFILSENGKMKNSKISWKILEDERIEKHVSGIRATPQVKMVLVRCRRRAICETNFI